MPTFNTAVRSLTRWIRARFDGLVRRLLQEAPESAVLAAVLDLSRSKADLVAENALLRQQLSVLHR